MAEKRGWAELQSAGGDVELSWRMIHLLLEQTFGENTPTPQQQQQQQDHNKPNNTAATNSTAAPTPTRPLRTNVSTKDPSELFGSAQSDQEQRHNYSTNSSPPPPASVVANDTLETTPNSADENAKSSQLRVPMTKSDDNKHRMTVWMSLGCGTLGVVVAAIGFLVLHSRRKLRWSQSLKRDPQQQPQQHQPYTFDDLSSFGFFSSLATSASNQDSVTSMYNAQGTPITPPYNTNGTPATPLFHTVLSAPQGDRSPLGNGSQLFVIQTPEDDTEVMIDVNTMDSAMTSDGSIRVHHPVPQYGEDDVDRMDDSLWARESSIIDELYQRAVPEYDSSRCGTERGGSYACEPARCASFATSRISFSESECDSLESSGKSYRTSFAFSELDEQMH